MSSILMKQKQDDPKPSKKTIKYLKLLTIKEPMKIHEEKDHIFSIGPQSSRHVLLIISDSHTGMDHQSRNHDFLVIQYW